MNTYPVSKAADPKAVEECQYGIGQEVKFTKFTSCLGVFCKINGKSNVIGVHLVLVDGNDVQFKLEDVPKIEKLLEENDAELDTGWVVGCLDKWPGDIKNAFYKMFEDCDGARILDKGDGFYSAKIKNNVVEVTFED